MAVELDLGGSVCVFERVTGLTHVDRHVLARELPGVKVKPVVGHLDLVAVDNLLLEDTVPVPQAVAPGGKVEGSKTVEEAGGQSTEATVSEGSVVLLLNDILDAEAEVVKTSYALLAPFLPADRYAALTLGNILQSDVEHGIVEGTAHEKLQREVVDTLSVDEGLALLGLVPLLDQTVAEGQTGGRVRSRLVAVEHATGESGLDMADDIRLKLLLGLEGSSLGLVPCFALGLRDGSYSETVSRVSCRRVLGGRSYWGCGCGVMELPLISAGYFGAGSPG